jgi:hypothetical protein
MAKIVYSAPISEIIGSIGGTTYQSNGSGFIVRSKPFNKRFRNSAQLDQMRVFAFLSQSYRNLSGANKLDWDAFAVANPHITEWDNLRIISGLQWYCVINKINYDNSQPLYSATQPYVNPTATPALTVTITATDINLSAASPIGLASEVAEVWASGPLRSSVNSPRKSFRHITNFQADTALPVNIAVAWSSIFGLSVNSSLFVPGNHIILAVLKYTNVNLIKSAFTFARS